MVTAWFNNAYGQILDVSMENGLTKFRSRAGCRDSGAMVDHGPMGHGSHGFSNRHRAHAMTQACCSVSTGDPPARQLRVISCASTLVYVHDSTSPRQGLERVFASWYVLLLLIELCDCARAL